MPAYIPLAAYLKVNADATPENGPMHHMVNSDESVRPIAEAFAAHSRALAEFVELARAHPKIGYKAARDLLERQVHLFIPADYDVFIPDDLSALDDLKREARGDDNAD